MQHIVLNETVLNHVESKIHLLTLDIKEHESNLKTIKELFDELIKDGISVERFSQFCRNVRHNVYVDLAQFILYELSSKHKEMVDSVYASVINYEDDFIINEDEYKEFTLDGNRLYIKFSLSPKVSALVSVRNKLNKIRDKCQYTEQFILDEEEYQFIFGK